MINLALFILFQVIQILRFSLADVPFSSLTPCQAPANTVFLRIEITNNQRSLIQNVARHFFCDVPTLRPEPNASECLHHMNMVTILCHFSSEWAKKPPQKAKR